MRFRQVEEDTGTAWTSTPLSYWGEPGFKSQGVFMNLERFCKAISSPYLSFSLAFGGLVGAIICFLVGRYILMIPGLFAACSFSATGFTFVWIRRKIDEKRQERHEQQ